MKSLLFVVKYRTTVEQHTYLRYFHIVRKANERWTIRRVNNLRPTMEGSTCSQIIAFPYFFLFLKVLSSEMDPAEIRLIR
jgi:hypothetical protein